MKIAISVSEKEKVKGADSPYFRAMTGAGAKPEELRLISSSDAGQFRTEDFDGILFAGGEDIDPTFYGEAAKYANVSASRDRDLLEFDVLDRARRAGLPVLGICRGSQMINVKFGGALYQDIKSDWTPESEPTARLEHKQPGDRTAATHSVMLTDPESLLARAFHGSFRVNSMHHQAIRRVGHGLKISARSDDGLVEAIEAGEGPFLLAVQWHPEELTAHVEHRKIFEMFVDECRARSEQPQTAHARR